MVSGVPWRVRDDDPEVDGENGDGRHGHGQALSGAAGAEGGRKGTQEDGHIEASVGGVLVREGLPGMPSNYNEDSAVRGFRMLLKEARAGGEA